MLTVPTLVACRYSLQAVRLILFLIIHLLVADLLIDAIYVGNYSRLDDVQAAPIQCQSTHSLTNIQHKCLMQFSHVFQQ